jgi:protein-L-isoaspartate(D-aspartate) O-methyltransferase
MFSRHLHAARIGLMITVGAVCLGGALLAQDPYLDTRRSMVDEQLRKRGIRQSSLLDAMQTVPRHLFVPESDWEEAYVDEALPVGPEGGLMQPYMTALMIELLALDGSQKVLEIGTGSGYDAAVLSRLAREVFTIEISRLRGEAAKARLEVLGYENVRVRIGDGNAGWPSEAPFDAIILTAAPERIPPRLIEQLAPDGKMVIPVGGVFQELTLITKTADGFRKRRIEPVRIGPMSRER